ncbi:MAG: PKD domain-containing protein [Chitinophagaceae bacterium]
MKTICTFLFAGVMIAAGCNKSNDLKPVTTDNTPTVSAKPEASFVITNQVTEGWVFEATELVFDNRSTNADSYTWSFGDGKSSTDKNPANISFSPCGSVVTVTLTAKNKKGEISSSTQTLTVLCAGKHGG